MNRRLFFKRSCAGALLLTCKDLLASVKEGNLRFGLVTDIHFAHRHVHGTRYYEQSMLKLEEAIGVFNKRRLDFMIELGDLKDQGDVPEREQTLAFLDEIEKKLQTFNGPLYHVLGNHDMDSISKPEFLAHTANSGEAKGKPYYAFVRNNIRFIVLDGNCNEDGTDYDSGQFDWTKAFIPPRQKEWLQQELAKDERPAILFIHELLDTFSGIDKELCIGNAEEIVSILEESKKVVAVIQGHHHAGNYSFRSGIHYFTMKGMIEGSLPENNSFAIIEIDKDLNIYVEGFYNCEDKEMNHRS